VVLIREADDFGNFGGGGRENDEIGAAFFDGAVVFVEDEVFGAGEDGGFAEEFLEGADEFARRRCGCWVVGHGEIRLAQMRRGWEMTRAYIEEELSESSCLLLVLCSGGCPTDEQFLSMKAFVWLRRLSEVEVPFNVDGRIVANAFCGLQLD
jgi:hypothetical protein